MVSEVNVDGEVLRKCGVFRSLQVRLVVSVVRLHSFDCSFAVLCAICKNVLCVIFRISGIFRLPR